MPRFARFVALGDSSTEGLDDPDGRGGHRGWADRLAERIAGGEEGLLYANLAVRARCAREIRDEQLAPALAMQPDLATVVAGMNDLLRWDFDAATVAEDVGAMQRALIAQGATVLSFTLPDISQQMPIGTALSARTAAINRELRRVSATTGAGLLDLAAYEVAADARLWSPDRLHANAAGHARIADALAHHLGLPGADTSWATPLPRTPPASRRTRLAQDLGWGRDYFLPWVWRRLRGRTMGDGVSAKRTELTPV